MERKLHDMRILGRIVGVRSTEQFVWHLLTSTSLYRIEGRIVIDNYIVIEAESSRFYFMLRIACVNCNEYNEYYVERIDDHE